MFGFFFSDKERKNVMCWENRIKKNVNFEEIRSQYLKIITVMKKIKHKWIYKDLFI